MRGVGVKGWMGYIHPLTDRGTDTGSNRVEFSGVDAGPSAGQSSAVAE